jgi:hypothetical protein
MLCAYRVGCPRQIEGVVADYGLGLGDLIGVITEFFSRVGVLLCHLVRSLLGSVPMFQCPGVLRRHQGYQAEECLQPVHRTIHGDFQQPSRVGFEGNR